MDTFIGNFDADEFTRRLHLGELDSRLQETLSALTKDQLNQVGLRLKPHSLNPQNVAANKGSINESS